MTKQALIERTIKAIEQLPREKAEEISAFVEFILMRFEEQQLREGMREMASNGQAFEFLREEEELYSKEDVRRKAVDQ